MTVTLTEPPPQCPICRGSAFVANTEFADELYVNPGAHLPLKCCDHCNGRGYLTEDEEAEH